MKTDRVLKSVVLGMLLLSAWQLAAVAKFDKNQFCLRGGLNMFMASGKDGDYVAGENDFPVTPAYQVPAFGFSYVRFFSPASAFGIDVRYGLSSDVDLRDPSDGETIRTAAPKSLTAVLNIYQYMKLSRSMKLFFSLGGGGEYRMVEEKEYISSLGNRIIISAPEKAFAPLAAAGIGLQYQLLESLGIVLECQAAYIFRTPAQILVSPGLAVVITF